MVLNFVGTDDQLTTEKVSPKTKNLDKQPVGKIIEIMNNEDKTVAESVQDALPKIEAAIEKIVEVMKVGGKLYYIGAGTSGRLGILDASECPPTFGVDSDLVTGIIAGGESAIRSSIENAEDDEEAGRQDIAKSVTSQDAVVGIAASGATPYVLGAVAAANDMGVVTVGISCNDHTPLSQAVQYAIELLVGPEILTGSTRLKAGTAQKMVLNMISTTAMIKLGKVYGNLMVNMKATNQKLRNRAIEIVRNASDVSYETARGMTDQANGDARAAILMIKYQISLKEAVSALNHSNCHFREAMHVIERRQS